MTNRAEMWTAPLTLVRPHDPNFPGYEENAIVPDLNQRQPFAAEQSEPGPSDSCLWLLEPPRAFKAMVAALVERGFDQKGVLNADGLTCVETIFYAYNLCFAGAKYSEPGMLTTTIQDQRRLVGLHTDQLAEGLAGPNHLRIGFNAGPGGRTVLACQSHTIQQIREGLPRDSRPERPSTADARAYLALGHTAMGVGVYLHPGEAYALRSTSQILHDGSTLESQLGSTVVLFEGEQNTLPESFRYS